MSAQPGSHIAGYRVISLLGSGGMGDVYVVENESLKRQEAMKVISVGGASNDDFQQRFTNEAQTAASLDHPSIITVHGYGVADGMPWFTMSYIKGKDLATERLTPADAVTVVEQVASGLDYAHARTVVHRDIKPANIVVTRNDDGSVDRAVMLDFGIAKLADSPQLTAVNSVVGTAAYTAPEIIHGQPASGKSDQYSLACTAYQLFAGVAPFKADTTTALMMAHIQTPPPILGQVRPDLGALGPVLQRAMAKDPNARYANCRAFAEDLRRALSQTAAGTATSVAGAPIMTPPPAPSTSNPGMPGPSTSNPGMPGPATSNPGMSNPGMPGPGMAQPQYTSQPGMASPHQTSQPGMTPPPQYTSQPGMASPMYGGQPSQPGMPVPPGQYPPTGGPQQPWGVAGGQPPKKSKRGLWIGLAVVSVIVIAVAAASVFLLGGDDAEDPVTAHPNMQIASTSNTTCSVVEESLYCWGSNDYGQVGDGGETAKSSPVKVPGLTAVTAVSIGSYIAQNDKFPTTTCAVADGDVHCWGANRYGQVGDGSTEGRSTPVKVPGLPKATGVINANASTCALSEEKEVYCWGAGEGGQLGTGNTSETVTSPQKVPGLSDVTQLTGNGGTFCAILGNGELHCWGNNGSGQLADGTGDPRNTPVKVPNLTKVTSASIGTSYDTDKKIIYRSICAVADGKVFCWGSGIGDMDQRRVPVEVSGISNVEQVAVAVGTVCAVSEGELSCWGNNRFGQVGNGGRDRVKSPTKVSELSGVTALGAGTSTTCVQVDSGESYCWGAASQGQIGNGTFDTEAQTRPVKIKF